MDAVSVTSFPLALMFTVYSCHRKTCLQASGLPETGESLPSSIHICKGIKKNRTVKDSALCNGWCWLLKSKFSVLTFTFRAFSRRFCPKGLTVIHTYIHTVMAVGAMDQTSDLPLTRRWLRALLSSVGRVGVPCTKALLAPSSNPSLGTICCVSLPPPLSLILFPVVS